MKKIFGTAVAYLAAETEYFLYINETEAICEDGLFRQTACPFRAGGEPHPYRA